MRPKDYSYVHLKRQKPLNDFTRPVKKKLDHGEEINNENLKKAFDNNILNFKKIIFFNHQGELYSSLLYAALDIEDTELIEFLVDRGVDLNAVEPGRDPFVAEFMTSKKSSYSSDISLAKKLINAGANINIDTTCGNCKLPLISKCLALGNERMAQLLIESGADIHPACPGESCRGCLPLSLAIHYRGSHKIVDLLLAKGVDVNLQTCSWCPSPLHMAEMQNRTKVIDRLLKSGADINAISNFCGIPVLFSAVKMNNIKAVELLLKNLLLDVNIQCLGTEDTALHHTFDFSLECLDSLLNANPDVNLVNNNNKLAVERDTVKNTDIQKAIDKIKNHLVKLRAAGFYLCDRNLAAVSGQEYDNFYTECCDEINLMKNTTISPTSHINFHDVLFITEQKLALCLESMDNQMILPSECHKNFPSYVGMIKYKLDKAIQWVKLRESLTTAVHDLFNNHLPSTIMEKIFNYFNVSELIKLQQYQEEFNSKGSNGSQVCRL